MFEKNISAYQIFSGATTGSAASVFQNTSVFPETWVVLSVISSVPVNLNIGGVAIPFGIGGGTISAFSGITGRQTLTSPMLVPHPSAITIQHVGSTAGRYIIMLGKLRT